jgi:dienelactone hydrolase
MYSMGAKKFFGVGVLLLSMSVGHLLGATSPAPASLPVGQVIDSVPCEDASESYALYLPSNYTPEKRWPIIYAFDPVARGKLPVTLFKNVAEKYGYIVAGSNNSRNFSLGESSKAANAMWIDTHAKLSLDERQIYTTGFSGGARVAGLLASSCPQCNIAGVIAQGAGYWDPSTPATGKFLYFLTVGNQDFNWPEVIGVRREREDHGTPYRVRVFAGPHQWAPEALVQEAVEWLHLKSMQSGRRTPEPAFIEAMFHQASEEAKSAEAASDAIAQLSAYRWLVSDFAGLKPVEDYETKLASLKKSSALKDALKKEQEEISAQQALTRDTSAQLGKLADAAFDERLALKRDIGDAFNRLQSQAEHADKDRSRNLYKRCFSDLWAQGIEAGQSQFVDHHYAVAVEYFKLMADVAPREPWPALLMAEAYTASGNIKEALKAIREAIKRGLKNPDALEKNRNLTELQSHTEFQKIVAELKKN